MNIDLLLPPRVTVEGLNDAVRDLDVDDFVRTVQPYLENIPDIPNDPTTLLVRCLHDIALPSEVPLAEWLEPYRAMGVDERWSDVVTSLRVRDFPSSSLLFHPEALGGGDFVLVDRELDGFNDDGDDFPDDEEKYEDWVARVNERATTVHHAPMVDAPLVRSDRRTLGVRLRLGAWDRSKLEPPRRESDDELVELGEAVAALIRPTLGGAQYLAPDPVGRALLVLRNTIVALLSHRQCQRSYGKERIVRADAYRAIFDALGVGHLFEAGRSFLETEHATEALACSRGFGGGEGRSTFAPPLAFREGVLVLARRL